MEKKSIISALVAILFIILVVFIANTAKTDDSISPSNIITVHAQYCDDCSKLEYCIDGIGPVFVGNCTFQIECNDLRTHTICVFCQGYKSGGGSPCSLSCGGASDIYVDCRITSVKCGKCGQGN